MPLFVVNPTSNTTPDPGQGGSAVTGNINTGHGSTVSAAGGNSSQDKTCIWQSWAQIGGLRNSVDLKLSYTAEATLQAASTGPGDFASASGAFTLQYSIDGGSSWLPAVQHTATAFSGAGSPPVDNQGFSFPAGSFSVSLSKTQDLSLVRVRDSGEVGCTEVGASLASGSCTFSVSNIRIEINVDFPMPVFIS